MKHILLLILVSSFVHLPVSAKEKDLLIENLTLKAQGLYKTLQLNKSQGNDRFHSKELLISLKALEKHLSSMKEQIGPDSIEKLNQLYELAEYNFEFVYVDKKAEKLFKDISEMLSGLNKSFSPNSSPVHWWL